MNLAPLETHAPRIGERGGIPLLAPPNAEAALALVRAARASGTRIHPTGNGTQLDWAVSGDATVEAWMHTPSMVPEGTTGVLEYISGDGTLTASAGASMDTLTAAVAEGGHRITPRLPGGSTLGGVLCSGRSGPDRLAFGPARHHVLGMAMIDGTGRRHRSGGRLVKNVTGFDLHRLHAGARGRFGVVLEASLRLMPLPEAEILMVSRPFEQPADAVRAALVIRALPHLKLESLLVEQRRLHVLLTGRAPQVDADTARVRADLDVEIEISGEQAGESLMAAWRGDRGLRVLTRPSRCAQVVEALGECGANPDGLSIDPAAAAVVLPEDEARRLAEPLSSLVAAPFAELGATVDARIPGRELWARPVLEDSVRDWNARLDAAFDPDSLFHAGARS